MANYYTQFSFAFPCTPEIAYDIEAIFTGMEYENARLIPDWFTKYMFEKHGTDICEELSEITLGCDYSYDANSNEMWIKNDEFGDIGLVGDVIAATLAHHNATTVIPVSIAYTCSRPRVNEFGGTAMVIGPGKVVIGQSTFVQAEKMAQEMQNELVQDQKQEESQSPSM